MAGDLMLELGIPLGHYRPLRRLPNEPERILARSMGSETNEQQRGQRL
jgi:hypothetical protein